MWALHSPPLIYMLPSFIKPHLLFSRYLSPRSPFLPTPTKPHNLCYLQSFRRRSIVTTVAAMGGSKTTPDHLAGDWFSVPGLRLRDHRFTVPLDYSTDHSTSPTISVFAREVVSVGKEDLRLPYLLYLQGGPGFESPRPTEASGWISKACEEYRVILLDQRGTGLSTPLTTSSMLQMKSAQDLVDYLKHFRADNIVNDAEFIRKRIVPGGGPWSILGQSYGGFCAVTYLSFAPRGLIKVFMTGGTPPLGDGCTAEANYRTCIEPIVCQNEKYYKRFPEDIEIVRDVVNHLAESEGGGVPLPSGGILTPKGLQLLGLAGLGASTGFERLHYVLERVWDPVLVPGAQKRISYYFLNAMLRCDAFERTRIRNKNIFRPIWQLAVALYEKFLSFDTNPLYALLHESIYCQGASSRWSAHRIRAEHENKFDAIKAAKEGRPVLFTGEMIFPWMFDEINALKPFKEAAHLLADKEDWPPLYDIAALNNNKVPVAAAAYYEDMFVNFKLATEAASQIAGMRLFVTNEYMHSGLRDGPVHILDQLMGMLNGKKPLF